MVNCSRIDGFPGSTSAREAVMCFNETKPFFEDVIGLDSMMTITIGTHKCSAQSVVNY